MWGGGREGVIFFSSSGQVGRIEFTASEIVISGVHCDGWLEGKEGKKKRKARLYGVVFAAISRGPLVVVVVVVVVVSCYGADLGGKQC